VYGFLNPCATGIVYGHNRDSGFTCDIHYIAYLFGMHLPHRTATHSKILAVDSHRASVNIPCSGDNPVARHEFILKTGHVACMIYMHTEFGK